jgi:hypothetical protein
VIGGQAEAVTVRNDRCASLPQPVEQLPQIVRRTGLIRGGREEQLKQL